MSRVPSRDRLLISNKVLIRKPIFVPRTGQSRGNVFRTQNVPERPEKRKKLFPNLWFVACITGCMIQCYFLTLDYMAFKTVSNIHISDLKRLENIALSVCVPFKYSLKSNDPLFCLKLPKEEQARYDKVRNARRELDPNDRDKIAKKLRDEAMEKMKDNPYKKIGESVINLSNRLANISRLWRSRCLHGHELSPYDFVNKYSSDVKSSLTELILRSVKFHQRPVKFGKALNILDLRNKTVRIFAREFEVR